MPVTLTHDNEGKYLHVVLTGKVNGDDYEALRPDVERLIEEHGSLRILVELRGFKGWSVSGLWEDIKFDASHFRDIERLAVIGEKRWHQAMATFCKLFTTAEIKYFDEGDMGPARNWLRQSSQDDVRETSSGVCHN